MNYALIVAGGKGKRFSSNIKKQFFQISHNIPIIEKTISVFNSSNKIDYIILVLPKEDIKNYLYLQETYPKLKFIIEGGEERFDSVLNGIKVLKKYTNINDNILVHDGVRPFVSKKLIENIINQLKFYPCVIPGIKIDETVKKVNEADIIKTLERGNLIRAQTPQGFNAKYIDLFEKANNKKIKFTDEASIFEYFKVKVKVVKGEKKNIKITTKEDLKMLTEANIKTGLGFDVHRFIQNRPLILAGTKINYKYGLDGHSDADVVTHALIDAILGASTTFDIGDLFPDDDPIYKNINSLELLKKVFIDYLKDKYEIIKIDITIICQEPKLKDYKLKMRENIANILEIPINIINIKAKTTEYLGFTGRKEGIATLAIITLKENYE